MTDKKQLFQDTFQKIKDGLFCDLETDYEKYVFFISGLAHSTGIIASSIAVEIAELYLYRHTKSGEQQ